MHLDTGLEILHPVTDTDRIAELRRGDVHYLDGWAHAETDLAALPNLPGTCRALVGPATPASLERASRYIHYPWRRTLVRLPDADLFHLLRTAHLPDHANRRRWRTAALGFAGAETIPTLVACARTGARRFRIAGPGAAPDRLSGSMCDLELTPVTTAVRQVLEVDPYSDITLFPAVPRVPFFGAAAADSLAVLFDRTGDPRMSRRARGRGITVVTIPDSIAAADVARALVCGGR